MTLTEVRSPRGRTVTLESRDETTDLATIGSTFNLWGVLHDEYGLADVHSDGLMVDVGAHIGTVAIAFLLDNPAARAVAIEPFPENVAMIATNAERAGVSDRLTIIKGAIGSPIVKYGHAEHRFIGNITGSGGKGVKAKVVTLGKFAPIDILKLDCEGCEWSALTDPVVAAIPLIIGEFHSQGADKLRELLEPTHYVETDGAEFTGNFRAVRR